MFRYAKACVLELVLWVTVHVDYCGLSTIVIKKIIIIIHCVWFVSLLVVESSDHHNCYSALSTSKCCYWFCLILWTGTVQYYKAPFLSVVGKLSQSREVGAYMAALPTACYSLTTQHHSTTTQWTDVQWCVTLHGLLSHAAWLLCVALASHGYKTIWFTTSYLASTEYCHMLLTLSCNLNYVNHHNTILFLFTATFYMSESGNKAITT